MSSTVYQWINVILLFSVLGVVLKKKLGAYFTAERKALDDKMKSAGAEFERIKHQYQEIQSAVTNLNAHIGELKQLSLREMENETRRLEADVVRSIDKMSVDGEARLKNEAERMKKTLEKELFQAALGQAKDVLEKDLKTQNEAWVAQMVRPDTFKGQKNYVS